MQLVVALLLFFLGQWEEHYLHVLRTNVAGLGVTEAQLALIAIHTACAFTSCDFWHITAMFHVSLVDIAHGKGIWPFAWTEWRHSLHFNELAAVLSLASALYACDRFVLNVLVWQRKLEAIASLVPSAILALTTALFFAPDTHHRFTLGDAQRGHVAVLLLTYGIAQVRTNYVHSASARSKTYSLSTLSADVPKHADHSKLYGEGLV